MVVLLSGRARALAASAGCYLSDDGQGDVDVAAGGVGVRADDVRAVHQGLCGLAIQAGQADAQFHFDAETGGDGADTDGTFDEGVCRDAQLVAGSDEFQGAEEAGRVAGGEQLFRVGTVTAGATEFFRGGQGDIQDAVGGNGAAFTATKGFSGCTVENVFDSHGGDPCQ